MLALLARSFLGQGGNPVRYYAALFTNPMQSAFYVPPAEAIGNSLLVAVGTVVLSLLVGLAAAYQLAGRPSPLKTLLDPLFMLPLGTSAVTLGLGFILALDQPPLNLRTSPLLLPLAHTLIAFPFVVRSVLPALRGLNPHWREAAGVLGASPARVVRDIDLPIVGRALLVGATYAFTVSIGEFGATLLIARPDFPTMPVVIYRLLGSQSALNQGQGLAMSTLLMLVCGVAFLLLERFRAGEIGEFWMALLDMVAISKRYGQAAVLHSVSFQVGAGETLGLLGPSGCGKTTLLRTIAGLELPDSGQILWEGRPLEQVPVHERGFGLVFQDYALFPNKDVAANIAFGLRMQRIPAPQVRARVAEMLDLVGLEGYEGRRVFELSGGEQQRVALARSLAPRPRLLMLDEPLGSLDRALREELLRELGEILSRVGVTSIYVTHDQQEAFSIASRVLVMNQGRILQQGTPEEVYRQPASEWVARFLGLDNLVAGRVVCTNPIEIETPLGCLRVAPGEPLEKGQSVTLLIRPEAARMAADCPGQGAQPLEGIVQECSFRGGHYRLVVRHGSGLVLAFQLLPGATALPRSGERVVLALAPEAIGILAEGEEASE